MRGLGVCVHDDVMCVPGLLDVVCGAGAGVCTHHRSVRVQSRPEGEPSALLSFPSVPATCSFAFPQESRNLPVAFLKRPVGLVLGLGGGHCGKSKDKLVCSYKTVEGRFDYSLSEIPSGVDTVGSWRV